MLFNEGDVENAISRLGITYSARGAELTALCPMHASITGVPDHNPSWSINVENGVHHCFSCSYSGTLLGLVADVLDFHDDSGSRDYTRAKRWLAEFTEFDLQVAHQSLEELRNHSYIKPVQPVQMSEARLAVYTPATGKRLTLRDIDYDTAAAYEILYDVKTDAYIIPIRHPVTLKLMGWQEKGVVGRYFKNRPAGIQKSLTLFGLKQHASNVAVVVESPLDVVKMASWGYPIGLATFGASISDTQMKLLRGYDKLILALDNDKAGKAATQEFRLAAREYGIEFFEFKYVTDVKDIGDMDQQVFEAGLMEATHCSLGGLELCL